MLHFKHRPDASLNLIPLTVFCHTTSADHGSFAAPHTHCRNDATLHTRFVLLPLARLQHPYLLQICYTQSSIAGSASYRTT